MGISEIQAVKRLVGITYFVWAFGRFMVVLEEFAYTVGARLRLVCRLSLPCDLNI